MRSQVHSMHYLPCSTVCTLRQCLDNSIVSISLYMLLLGTGAMHELLKVLNASLPVERGREGRNTLCVSVCVYMYLDMHLCVRVRVDIHKFIKKAQRKLLQILIQFIVLFVKNCQITDVSSDFLTASTHSNWIIKLANGGTVLVRVHHAPTWRLSQQFQDKYILIYYLNLGGFYLIEGNFLYKVQKLHRSSTFSVSLKFNFDCILRGHSAKFPPLFVLTWKPCFSGCLYEILRKEEKKINFSNI